MAFRNQIEALIMGVALITWTSRSTAIEITAPEFECVSIAPKDEERAVRFLGNRSYPSVSLRRFASGQWQFRIKDRTISINREKVSKTIEYATKKTSYAINFDNSVLKFELIGIPPSRQGELWEFSPAPTNSVLIAQLTCH
jgi:hypothetical protein